MPWDPEVESPATIAIIGAGATGIEAALYARFLGYQVLLFEAGKVAQRYREVASLVMDESMERAVSPLGLRALEAQSGKPAEFEHRPVTYREFSQQYLLPLARTDLVHDCVQFQCEVIDISRVRINERMSEDTDFQARCNDEFRLVLRSKARGIWSTRADVILDCSGLATAGPRLGPCFGWTQLIEYSPDDLVCSLEDWLTGLDTASSATTMIWGCGGLSREAVERFLEKSNAEPRGKLIWLIPEWSEAESDDEALARIKKQLNDSASLGYSLQVLGVENLTGSVDGNFKGYANVLLPDDTFLKVGFDRFLDLDRVRANFDFARALMFQPEQGWNIQSSTGPQRNEREAELGTHRYLHDCAGWRLATVEPGYYILGSKRKHSNKIAFADRRADIRDVFALLGGRADLDLYA